MGKIAGDDGNADTFSIEDMYVQYEYATKENSAASKLPAVGPTANLENDKPQERTEEIKNGNGQVIEKRIYNSEGKVRHRAVFDPNTGEETKYYDRIYKNKDPNDQTCVEEMCDNRFPEQIVSEAKYNKLGQEIEYLEYETNEDGSRVEDESGNLVIKTHYKKEYNENGSYIQTNYDNNGNVIPEKTGETEGIEANEVIETEDADTTEEVEENEENEAIETEDAADETVEVETVEKTVSINPNGLPEVSPLAGVEVTVTTTDNKVEERTETQRDSEGRIIEKTIYNEDGNPRQIIQYNPETGKATEYSDISYQNTDPDNMAYTETICNGNYPEVIVAEIKYADNKMECLYYLTEEDGKIVKDESGNPIVDKHFIREFDEETGAYIDTPCDENGNPIAENANEVIETKEVIIDGVKYISEITINELGEKVESIKNESGIVTERKIYNSSGKVRHGNIYDPITGQEIKYYDRLYENDDPNDFTCTETWSDAKYSEIIKTEIKYDKNNKEIKYKEYLTNEEDGRSVKDENGVSYVKREYTKDYDENGNVTITEVETKKPPEELQTAQENQPTGKSVAEPEKELIETAETVENKEAEEISKEADAKLAEAERRLKEADAKLAEAERRLKEAEEISKKADARLAESERRLKEAEEVAKETVKEEVVEEEAVEETAKINPKGFVGMSAESKVQQDENGYFVTADAWDSNKKGNIDCASRLIYNIYGKSMFRDADGKRIYEAILKANPNLIGSDGELFIRPNDRINLVGFDPETGEIIMP